MSLGSSQVIVRAYEHRDREAIRRINYETSFLLKPQLFFDDREIVADALTRYYTDFEPGSCFVAETQGRVIGYIVGTLDLTRMRREYGYKILLPLIIKALFRGVFFNIKTLRFLGHYIQSYFKGEFRIPHFLDEYPATFHINVDDGFRGQKVGSRLIEEALRLLKEKHISGVQFSTMSDESVRFFTSIGFQIVYDSRRSFLRYALGHDTPFHLFGKKL